jgi:hypothetical protein
MDRQSLILLITSSGGVAALVVWILALVRQPLEALPWAHPDAPGHDITLQAFNVLANFGLLLLVGVATGQLQLNNGGDWALLVTAALIQAGAGHVGYNTVKDVVKANQAAGGVVAGAKTETLPAPAAGTVADWPAAPEVPVAQ